MDLSSLRLPEDAVPFTKEPLRTWEVFVEREGLGMDAFDADMSHLDILGEDIEKKLLAWCKKPDRTLYLWGPPGSGKTYAGICILKYLFSSCAWMRYLEASKISEIGRKEGSEYLKSLYGECQLLLIDDLGVDIPRDWEQKYTFDLIEMRCQKKRLPTIVTSNISKSDLAKIVTERVTSRLIGTEIQFKAKDLR